MCRTPLSSTWLPSLSGAGVAVGQPVQLPSAFAGEVGPPRQDLRTTSVPEAEGEGDDEEAEDMLGEGHGIATWLALLVGPKVLRGIERVTARGHERGGWTWNLCITANTGDRSGAGSVHCGPHLPTPWWPVRCWVGLQAGITR
jgi:hypothetical protein